MSVPGALNIVLLAAGQEINVVMAGLLDMVDATVDLDDFDLVAVAVVVGSGSEVVGNDESVGDD